MLQTMLVGLDGSDFGFTAAELALNWSKRFNALVAALGVVDEPMIRSPQAEPVGGADLKEFDAKHINEAREEIRAYLGKFEKRCQDYGVDCRLIKEKGRPSEQILLDAQIYDLLLLGKENLKSKRR